ncbi:hypothetical protein [Prevotella scopos]|uniref:hypothetical protein n=1 Tax=Prevotella scopos TaxID=589437 RepID=UPI000B2F02A4|nr:hypothetical protein [Prevotella scopos]
MSNQNKQHKFTKSLTFRILCVLAILIVLGLIYNFIVAADDTPMTEQEEEEVQKRNADADTIDIIGDYLWPQMKPSKEDMMTDEEKAAEAEKAKEGKDGTEKATSDKVLSTNMKLLSLSLPLLLI